VEALIASLNEALQPIPFKSLPVNLLLEQGKQNGDQAKYAILLPAHSPN
jgi:hypothetical protein